MCVGKVTFREILGADVMIVRKVQKNMYLTVLPDGTPRVTCPTRTSDAAIDRFLTAHAEWLKKRREAVLTRADRFQNFSEGERVPLWGRLLTLEIRPERPYGGTVDGEKLVLRAPLDSTQQEREELIKSFRRSQMVAALPPLLRFWQEKIGVACTSFHVREMTSRWGSCSTRTGRLCFNLRLSEKGLRCLEYVVVHELCHLVVPNHSAAFWNCVAKCLPNWRELRSLTEKSVES